MSHARVVLFSGGRGSQALTRQLAENPHVDLTLAINGYDDGKSTGEIRRSLGDCLGPSDFRKNATTLAEVLHSCPPALPTLLEFRLPPAISPREALAALRVLGTPSMEDGPPVERQLADLAQQVGREIRAPLSDRVGHAVRELGAEASGFSFADCSVGNLVFAGCFLASDRRFNSALDDYCTLVGLPAGLIENVTDGANAYLTAVDREARFLASEAEIVEAGRRNHIAELFLIGRPLQPDEVALGPMKLRSLLEARSVVPQPNVRLLKRVAEADLIIYGPGTQHSSLLPSYLTDGLGEAIARNIRASKVLVTNIHEDTEIPDANAVEIIERALYYLRQKDVLQLPTPCLITHYLLNAPDREDVEDPYVQLGPLQTLEDPRLVRIANFEDGLTGRHHATRVLSPFLETFVQRGERLKVAVALLDASSPDKVAQTVLEASRAGLADLHVEPHFLWCGAEDLLESFRASLPYELTNVHREGVEPERLLLDAIRAERADYIVLFESSGMYMGEDIVGLLSQLTLRRPGAVWGSRRLSALEVRESYKLRYRRNRVLGLVSWVGSHMLGIAYLFLYGRHVSDVLSGARAVRGTYLEHPDIQLGDKCLNEHVLSMLLRDKAEVIEMPVQFFSMSPDKVKRTTVGDGVRAFRTIIAWRWKSL